MQGGTPLAELFVQLIADGIVDVNAQTAEITKRFAQAAANATRLEKSLKSPEYAKLAKAMQAVEMQTNRLNAAARKIDLQAKFGQLGGSIMDLKEKTASFTTQASVGFGLLSAGVMGWVRSGMQGTVEGNRLAMQFRLLSLEIAGVFKPAIDWVVTNLGAAVKWFQSLSKSQQDNIRKWTLITAGVLGAVVVFKMLIGLAATIVAVWTRISAVVFGATSALATQEFALVRTAAGWTVVGNAAAVAGAKMAAAGKSASWLSMAGRGIGPTVVTTAALAAINRGTDEADKNDRWLGRNLQRSGMGFSYMLNSIDPFSSHSARVQERNRLDREASRSEAIWSGKDPDAKKKQQERNRVTLEGGGFESLSGTWDRVVGEAMKQGAEPERQQVELLKDIKMFLMSIAGSSDIDRWQQFLTQFFGNIFNRPAVQ